MKITCNSDSQTPLVSECSHCYVMTESDSCPVCHTQFDGSNAVYLQPCGECHDIDDHQCMHMTYRLHGSNRKEEEVNS